MSHLWIDASAGIAGDMLLGALIDAGADLGRVQAAVDAVVPGAVRITDAEVRRAGLRARKVEVTPVVADQPHRTWRDIRGLLPEGSRAAAVFARLAEAEAAVHGVSAEEVHFHEVGALDAIADVVGVCAALDDLGVSTVSASEVAVGSGTVRAAHGVLPVPAPAVAELSRGWRIRAGGVGELATPTGMALVRTLAATCENLPSLTVTAVGVGAGTRDTPERPNVVRVILGSPAAPITRHSAVTQAVQATPSIPATHAAQATPSSPATHAAQATPSSPAAQTSHVDPTIRADETARADQTPRPDRAAQETVAGQEAVLLEANVDDLDPRLWPGVISALLEAGADDAWLVPILMKKGRPAHTLTALCSPTAASEVRDRIFQETTTFGVRSSARTKTPLDRTFVQVEVDGYFVAVKIGHAGGVIVQVMPEFEDVATLARSLGVAQRDALVRATRAAAAAGLVIGASPPAA
ncbi:nickel pincer cofactor biosynthesis protein LarC [Actinoplanes sp. L3-i22]|uniref:nickel pincer cofactor biosynthesis protein LarC n=1 Tax=Actinoplanes sp. L3-i22 TaxID=2836373 RepID=UPI001C751E51|nr:nickel pincer cofactor biosynthesis protein LarC [Actinoplanes sp. L3-i22]BCY11224.1 hypothetical protein L3i22_063120 [Actinoplanes sp. L3-i22]